MSKKIEMADEERRLMEMNVCATCRFWMRYTAQDKGPFFEIAEGTGECRRNPPVLDDRAHKFQSTEDAAGCAQWPVTWDGHWCGQHQPRLPTAGDVA
ncbi:hypothetical protein [Sphingobium chungbukense]|uniref:Uncharacterized protein n=1 Tax=Sphingobium chungbukense TaxID=56193 RepID=A0A0M3ATJ8_9SPHN|nr:hypothetical protein [Sphingobium chungbukense]KKW92261.1 hypothetical protein YP76_10035 [Sphingobium chungbukense]